MLAHGSWLGATTVLVLAKLVGTGVAAFIFDVTRPKLLQLPWFRWLYEHVLVLAREGARTDRSDQAAHQARRTALRVAVQARPSRPLLPPHRAHSAAACRRSRRSSSPRQ
jgi:hypothetical protein